jgi:antimicrobial peptide system SdpB family protein
MGDPIMAIVYLCASIGKMFAFEWLHGSAVHYYFTNPYIGANPILLKYFSFFFYNPSMVYIVTWGTLIVELLLFTGLVATPGIRKVLFITGIGLHFGIWIIHGFFSFSMVMCCALGLFLLPLEKGLPPQLSLNYLKTKLGFKVANDSH